MEIYPTAIDVSVTDGGSHNQHGRGIEMSQVVRAPLEHLRVCPRLAAHARSLVVAAETQKTGGRKWTLLGRLFWGSDEKSPYVKMIIYLTENAKINQLK